MTFIANLLIKLYSYTKHSDSGEYKQKIGILRKRGIVVSDIKRIWKGLVPGNFGSSPKTPSIATTVARSQKDVKPDLTFDDASKRRFDENGFLHVEASPISKEAVNEMKIPVALRYGNPDRNQKLLTISLNDFMAPPGRLEHPAKGLGNLCSIRLSYGGVLRMKQSVIKLD